MRLLCHLSTSLPTPHVACLLQSLPCSTIFTRNKATRIMPTIHHIIHFGLNNLYVLCVAHHYLHHHNVHPYRILATSCPVAEEDPYAMCNKWGISLHEFSMSNESPKFAAH